MIYIYIFLLKFAGLPVRRLPVRRFTGSPVRRSPVSWLPPTTLLHSYRPDALQTKTGDFFTIKGLLVFSCDKVLEVVRTEWLTNASSWKPGRSTPSVTVDSKGLMDGRHQCFKVAATLMRRSPVAGRRYADSPVY